MKSGSGEPTLFAQGSALGWELFGPQGADAQGVALGLTQSFPHFLGDAASAVATMKSGSGEPTLFAQGSALGWELFGPQGADAQGVALGLTQSFPHFLGDAQRQMTVVNLNSNPRQIYFSRSRPSPSVFMGLDSHFVGAA